MAEPTIQNIVSTFNCGTWIDLRDVAARARNVEYSPKRFSAAIMRIRNPKTTCLIFSTGRMVVTGAKNRELSRLAARKFARILSKLGYEIKNISNFCIQNIVGSFDFGCKLRLEVLSIAYSKFCVYEPELFPGLNWRFFASDLNFKFGRCCLLIFKSGKVVITGAKSESIIFEAHKFICSIIKQTRNVCQN